MMQIAAPLPLPFVAERTQMRRQIRFLVLDLPTMGVGPTVVVEHGYEQNLIRHAAALTVNKGAAAVVILHPEQCGCDALTHELVLHG